MKNKNMRLKGQLRMYMQWPLIMTILLLAMNIWMYMTDQKAGLTMTVFVIIYAIIVGLLYFYNRSLILADLIQFSTQYKGIQNTLLKELTVPYAIILEDGHILWKNDRFSEIVDGREKFIQKIIPELNKGIFPKDDETRNELEITYKERDYQVELRRISLEGFSESERMLQIPKEKEYFIALYMRDVTELNSYIRENEDQRLIAGLIYIDNYDEVMESVEEVRQSLLVALIDRKINKYINDVDGIVKKLENDKYFFVVKKESYRKFEADKFSLLEEVKQVNIGNARSATLSIGLGLNTATYALSYNYARMAIDLALARGGDQAVIKDCNGITYYGGKREQTSKNTRVKARVKAEALREFITVKDKIFVMGHKLTDVDAFGAAIGIYRAAAALEKNAHIVINEISASLRPLYECYEKDPSYPDDLFLTSAEAIPMVDEESMVIVVDTNRPQMTECEELLKKTKTIVVLDHHRQSTSPPTNGSSIPTMTRSTSFSFANAVILSNSMAPMGAHSAYSEMPALPGVQ